ncbi:MAG: hypothetical protein IKI29_01750 [Clostridia bacterium]|nr:hypothetical protein [Clostridia bacterium]
MFEQLQSANEEIFSLRRELQQQMEKYELLVQNMDAADASTAEEQPTDNLPETAVPAAEKPVAETVEPKPDPVLSEPFLLHTEEKSMDLSEEQLNLSAQQQYGAKIIGRIVLKSAQNCNSLTADGETRHEELVNLILGRAEVAKSEILGIVSSDLPFEEQQKAMNDCCEEALSYFENVMRQKED